MDLGLDVADVDIDMGFGSNHCVRLFFRKKPSKEVEHMILSIAKFHEWKLETTLRDSDLAGDKIAYVLHGDYTFHIIGIPVDVVGNSIGKGLKEDHGMKVRYRQFCALPTPGHSKLTDVSALDLKAKVED